MNRLIDSKGAAYLHQLLAQPGQARSVVELAYAVARNGRAAPDRSEDSVLDPDALDAYRNRLLELSVQRAKAETDNNVPVIAELDAEYLQIEKELSSAVSPRGQNRTLKSERDRLRKSVGNAVRRTIRQIAKYDQALATHLQKPVLTCGSVSRYQPVKEIVWATN